MAKAELTAKDRERLEAARQRGEAGANDQSALVDASYDKASDAVHLRFRGGGSMVIPRAIIPGLERQSTSSLEAVSVSPAGDALSWRLLDIDIYLPGLVERAFGNRLFAAATGRLGGRRRTKAKAAAARRNGTKGGRPRKPLSA
jgi:hypothetical protein